MDNGEKVDVIYIDVKKAFDEVPHERLLKITWICIREMSIHGSKNFLQTGNRGLWLMVSAQNGKKIKLPVYLKAQSLDPFYLSFS